MPAEPIHVRPYEERDAASWNAFVADAANGTVFHQRRFLAYHPRGRFRDASLVFAKRGRTLAVLPAAEGEMGSRRTLRSHPGSSYGGLVIRPGLGAEDCDALVAALLRSARDGGFSRIELRSAPRVFQLELCDALDFAYYRHGFRPERFELSTCYDVARLGSRDPRDEVVLASFEPRCRGKTRQALRSRLKTRACDDLRDLADFHRILSRNLEKHRVRPTHSAEELAELKKRLGDDLHLLGVLSSGRMIAGTLAFACNRRAMHLFYIAADPDFLPLRPVNLAVLRAIQLAARRGVHYLNFGISTEDGGRCANWGLFRFKEGFGGRGVLRCTWVAGLGEAETPAETARRGSERRPAP